MTKRMRFWKWPMALFFICCGLFLHAQTTYDLTTGKLPAVVGSPDVNWTVRVPGSMNYGTAFVAKTYSGYAEDDCGKWISPSLNASNEPSRLGGGDYYYRTAFTVLEGGCFTYELDLSFAAADNFLREITINGDPVPIPAGIDFNPGVPIPVDVTPLIIVGGNVVEVKVENEGPSSHTTETALMLCGGIQAIPKATSATVVDLTTGTNSTPFGDSDPNWIVQEPNPNTAPFAPYVAKPLFDSFNPPNSYITNTCGRWVSPFLWPASHPTKALQPRQWDYGTYTYSREFTIDDDCTVSSAEIDISFILADNTVNAIRVNNQPITIPATSINHLVAQAIAVQDITAHLTTGVNTLEIEVENYYSGLYYPTPTGLFVCGAITILQCCDECITNAPGNLSCSALNGGGIGGSGPTTFNLGWDPVFEATGYEIEVIYNDPACCSTGGFPSGSFFQTAGAANSLSFTTFESCFSWRVRSLCPEGGVSPWSAYTCSCGGGFSLKGTGEQIEDEVLEGEIFIYPNPAKDQLNISFDQWDTDEAVTIEVLDQTGRSLQQTLVSSSQHQINVAELASGVYFLRVQQGPRISTYKWMKE